MNQITSPRNHTPVFQEIDFQMLRVEDEVLNWILNALIVQKPGRDRGICDGIFSHYTQNYFLPCVRAGMVARAAWFGREVIIPKVMQLEKNRSVEFHKGVIFYDSALAHLICGNEDDYEFMAAMADEEDVKTSNGTHVRGSLTLREIPMTAPTLQDRMQLACDLLNGTLSGHSANYSLLIGGPPVDADRLSVWRSTLEPLHHLELLRILHEIEVFLGNRYPYYESVKDHPLIMLRAAKTLSHLAQWVESCLSDWQKPSTLGTLHPKLNNDPDFGSILRNSASRDGYNYPGSSLTDLTLLNGELQQLLSDVTTAAVDDQKHWRVLRILYLVRNSTAHTIELNLSIYTDRKLLIELIQVVLVSIFVICKLKTKAMP